MIDPGPDITVEQLAGLLGVSKRRVFQMAHEGNPPPKTVDGTYLCSDIGKWLREKIKADLGVSSTGNAYDYDAEKARLTFHQANISSLEEEIKKRQLIPAEEVKQEWGSIVANFRARLLALPGKLAVVGAATSTQEAEQEARKLVHEALRDLADGLD